MGFEDINSKEGLREDIDSLLKELDELNDLGEGRKETLYDLIGPELQDEMYYVEMEAETGEDLEQAKNRLEELMVKLRKEAEKIKEK